MLLRRPCVVAGRPSWSPDGTEIAFAGQRGYESTETDIYKINTDGSGMTRLTNDPHIGDSPAWSPGGEKIAYEILAADASDRPHKPVVPYTR
jgi:Tol biopolymer transport system component